MTMPHRRVCLHQGLACVGSQSLHPQAESDNVAYTLRCPKGKVVAIESGTAFAAELRDFEGDPLPDDTRVIVQKADKFGNPLSGGVIFNDILARFDYQRMRSDPDYFRTTHTDLLLQPDEYLDIRLELTQGAQQGFCPELSSFSFDGWGDGGHPYIAELEELSTKTLGVMREKAGVERAEPNSDTVEDRIEDNRQRVEYLSKGGKDRTDSEGRPDARVAYADDFDDVVQPPERDELTEWWREVRA